MKAYEKRKNIAGGIIMYAIMTLTYFITAVSYFITIVRGYATPYTWVYLFENLMLIFFVAVALVVMIIRKRQSGFGVASPMMVSLANQLIFLVAVAIQNASTYRSIHPNWTAYLSFLLIIPIVLVIVYFFVPNKAMQIISSSVTVIALFTDFTVRMTEIFTAFNRGYFNGRYAFSLVFALITVFSLYALIVVQIFASFRKTDGSATPAAFAPVGYSAAQPVEVKTIPAEQIMANYQALLEKGLINQEQFDEKKKELYGE